MAIQGLGNNFFDLSSIRSIAGGSAARTGGSFDLGGNAGVSNNLGQGDLGLGNVASSDTTTEGALNSVAGESAIQAQFRNQLALINLQERIQNQSRTVEILTNVLKSRHDASMAAARNVK
ncbi:MAG: hypothetical protein JNN15_14850 [Blastocatellia bacterium]|jgi:hypothetical protein|nr:hypothetical protein [Blastocatellia bacterium]